MNSTSAQLARTHAVLPESICMALLDSREDPDPSRMEERHFHPATPSLPPRERVLRPCETARSWLTIPPLRGCGCSLTSVATAALERVGERHHVVIRLARLTWSRRRGRRGCARPRCGGVATATAPRSAPLLQHVRDRHEVRVQVR